MNAARRATADDARGNAEVHVGGEVTGDRRTAVISVEGAELRNRLSGLEQR